MPDPRKLLATLRRATELFRATPGRTGSVVSLDAAQDVIVVGDLHGHVETFARVFKIAALDRFPSRHLVVQELVHDPRADPDVTPDRSHRLVDLVAALKCQYPDRVHYLLGNHELSELTTRSISKNGVFLNVLFKQGVQSAYGDHTEPIYRAYLNLFRSLPLALRTPNRVFICHTVPDDRDFDKLDLKVLETGDWPPESLERGGTVYALTWGRDLSDATVDRFGQLVDADLFLIGHHPCEGGFQRGNDRVVILDGTDPYPAYCHFSPREPLTIETLLECVRIVPLTS
jgi:hypothetical protein